MSSPWTTTDKEHASTPANIHAWQEMSKWTKKMIPKNHFQIIRPLTSYFNIGLLDKTKARLLIPTRAHHFFCRSEWHESKTSNEGASIGALGTAVLAWALLLMNSKPPPADRTHVLSSTFPQCLVIHCTRKGILLKLWIELLILVCRWWLLETCHVKTGAMRWHNIPANDVWSRRMMCDQNWSDDVGCTPRER